MDYGNSLGIGLLFHSSPIRTEYTGRRPTARGAGPFPEDALNRY